MWFPQREVAEFLFDPKISNRGITEVDKLPEPLKVWIQSWEGKVNYVRFDPTYGNGNVEWYAKGWFSYPTKYYSYTWSGRFWALNIDVARCEMSH